MKSTKEILQQAKELCDAASPEPWDDKPASNEWLANGKNNYDFCRKSRTLVPRLIDALEMALTQLTQDCYCGYPIKPETQCSPCRSKEEINQILNGECE